jgi:hypothetical protein
VVDAEDGEHRGVQVEEMDRVFGDVVAEVGGATEFDAGLHAGTRRTEMLAQNSGCEGPTRLLGNCLAIILADYSNGLCQNEVAMV